MPECVEYAGYAFASDARYEGRRTAVVCVAVDDLEWERSVSGWNRASIALGLHELGHIWMLDHIDAGIRDAFTERASLPSWDSPDTPWRQRAEEHAANTLAWGLAGTDDARYMRLERLDLDSSAAASENLPVATLRVGDGEG